MNDETIMPDGRPFFAWRNEIEMAKDSLALLDRERLQVKNLLKLLNVVIVESQVELSTGDILIRLRRNLSRSVDDLNDLASHSEVTINDETK